MRWLCFAIPPLATVLSAGATGQPDAAEIVKRSVAVTELNWAASPHYAYVSRDANIRQRSAKTYDISMIEGSPYRKLIAEEDQPLSDSRRNQEEQKIQRETRKREHEPEGERRRRIARYEEDRERDHLMLSEVANAFDYSLLGEQTLETYEVWMVQGLPKPGYIAKSRDAKVMAGMKVTLWIDKTTYQWLMVEAEVVKPISLYGSLAKVGPGTRFKLEQEPVESNVWLPRHFTMEVSASAFGFLNREMSEDYTYQSYRRVPEVAARLKIP